MVRNQGKTIRWSGYDSRSRRASSHRCEKLKTAQSRQKSQYDRHHKAVTYEVSEKAYLWVTPLKGTHRFSIKGKLAPSYIGPFPILAKRGGVAYQLELPPHLSRVHD